jgi:signal peptidase I
MYNLIKALVWIAALLGVVIGIARLVAIRWWRVPEDDPYLVASFAPTLRGGDWVLLWRATPPAFGSLVICPDPDDASKVVIGRIAGEPGDKVEIEGERIKINGVNVYSEAACNDAKFSLDDPTTGEEVEQRCDIESMGGVAHERGTLSGLNKPGAPLSTRVVDEGQVFLVSDNRAYPYDSRTYGALDRAACKESIFFRLIGKSGYFDVKSRFTYIR